VLVVGYGIYRRSLRTVESKCAESWKEGGRMECRGLCFAFEPFCFVQLLPHLSRLRCDAVDRPVTMLCECALLSNITFAEAVKGLCSLQ